jgi:glycosyltransferase involved in cell wall biosynthesis
MSRATSAGSAVRFRRPQPGDVSVVICAYLDERWQQLCEAVDSVRSQVPAPREIIVAVDHNPALLERVRRAMPDVVAVASSGRPGKPGALSTAVSAASGSIIALIDDDAAAEPGWLTSLVGGYDDETVLGVGGWISPAWAEIRPAWFPDEFLWVFGCTYRGMPRERAEVRNLIGANMSFRIAVFRAVDAELGGADTTGALVRLAQRDAAARHALEDTELCLRASRIFPGGRWVYEPAARVRHHVPASRARWKYFRSRCWVEGLAKAGLSRTYGGDRALASEWRYAARTLPAGVARALGAAVVRREPSAVARAGAIVAGLAITTAGYVRGRISGAGRSAGPNAATQDGGTEWPTARG